ELGRHRNRQSSAYCNVNHLLAHALGMHIEWYSPPASRNAIKHRLPEIETALRHATFPVNAKCESIDGRHLLKQHSHRIAAIRSMCRLVQPFNRVICIGTVDPLISVHPQTNTELQPPHHALFADVLQHLQVAVAFLVRQLRYAHVITRYFQQKWISKQEVRIRNLADEVIPDTKSQVKAIESLRSQHVEILRPHGAVVIPWQVFNIAAEQPGQASHLVRRLLHRCFYRSESSNRVC